MNQLLARPPWAAMLLVAMVTTVSHTANARSKYKFSYYANGRICVDRLGELDGKRPIIVPPVQGQQDFKPSWSKTRDKLVFFRRVKNDPVVGNWKTALCIINVDGTGFHQLTDGTHTDFNPTWTRDGTNTPIWNRKKPEGGYTVMASKVGGKPGEEFPLSDPSRHAWAHSCLKDGRILVASRPPEQRRGYYLMTPHPGGKPTYERIDVGDLQKEGLMCRISISPDEKKVCFGHLLGHKFKEPEHAMCIADFDVKRRTVTNVKIIANKEYGPGWFAYPRWTKDSKAVIYHANTTGKGQLFLYTLKDGTTEKVSTNDSIDYRYPHGEATPK